MNLWLVAVSRSVSMGNWCVCCAALYPSSVVLVPILWVRFCVQCLLRWNSCAGRTAGFGHGYTETIFLQKKDPTSIHIYQFFMSDLRKINGCQPWRVCSLVSAEYWQIWIANRWLGSFWKQVKLQWNWWRCAPSFTAALCLKHHSNIDTPVRWS